MDEDLKLVQEVLKGNIDSFNILVNKYELTILRFVYNILKDREAAEDITQEVFITVYNKLYTFDKNYKFSNWIFQIARNKCIDYIRKYKRVYEANVEETRDIASSLISPEQSVEFKETKKLVENFLNTLNDVDKQIIILRYSNENITFRDMAEIMKMTESAVKRRYYKARDKFKEFRVNKEERCK
ncbi:sigma-70 family RNA polymerase sigma factor [Clostridium sp. SYSU_GA19001]|uniref:RNA polymerase sigma factor n=1 Tax=Clostridium caldaquaticum TaxID=2940653 RepID=UPI0020771781|nr:sigma-70 family RNA polymerase sigma factor [Clostridium caldaquaticum]MCM8710749.1 sigma-70 family RNA polymerase sigma factor [Clostridium caldaquaticum]